MTAVLLRRRKLGRSSCNGIAQFSEENIVPVRHWRDAFPNDTSYIFRWGCTASLPEQANGVVVNTAAAIHWCSDKRQGRLDMQAAGVPVPETWATDDWNGGGDDHTIEEQFVSRPATHAQGRNLSVGNYMTVHLWPGGYISRKIDKVAEYRVFVCQNRVVWVARKTPGNPEDVAWNVAQGGRFDNVRWGEWKLPVVKAALAAAKVSGTDFCGVDVMEDAEGNPYVLEVNSAPSQTSEYRQRCVAKAFDLIIREGKEAFPDPTSIRGWRDVIHPGVYDE